MSHQRKNNFLRSLAELVKLAPSSFLLSQSNRQIMASSAGRSVHSSRQLLKFLLYASIFPALSLYSLLLRSRPRPVAHFLWADKISAHVIDPIDIVRLPFPGLVPSTLRSWCAATLLALLRILFLFRIQGGANRIEFLAFVCEAFVIDLVLLTGCVKIASTASALDRKSVYISNLASFVNAKHIVYQHGVINKFEGVYTPHCDVFICCFPWSLRAVSWVYEAKAVEVLPGNQWHFPGWVDDESIDVMWATSPISRSECVELINKVVSLYPVCRVSVKPHPRDSNIDLYQEIGFRLVNYKSRRCRLVIGQMSTVLAEAAMMGIKCELVLAGDIVRRNCLEFADGVDGDILFGSVLRGKT